MRPDPDPRFVEEEPELGHNPRITAATSWADANLARDQKAAWQAGWAMYLAIVRGPDNRPSLWRRVWGWWRR